MNRHRRGFISFDWFLCTAAIAIPLSALAGAQEPSLKDQALAALKAKMAQVGVFYRADAPRVLRDRRDPYLPVFLEVINGVERTGRSTSKILAENISREPLRINGVNVFIKPTARESKFAAQPVLLSDGGKYTLDFRTQGRSFAITDRLKRTLELPLETVTAYLTKNYQNGQPEMIDLKLVFLVEGHEEQDFYLRIRLNAPQLPSLNGWYRGDLHYHCGFTDNPAERGYPLNVTKQAALDSGFNWVVLADHSTDLTAGSYEEELREVMKYRDDRLVLIRGEEVTLASGKDALMTTIHMVALPSPEDPDKGFPDPEGKTGAAILTGDGSPDSPAMPLAEALKRVSSAGGFAFAAHPFDPVSPILRGGQWDLDIDFLKLGGKALADGLVGLEPWNRASQYSADDSRDPFCIHPGADPAGCFRPDPGVNTYTRLEKGIEVGWKPLLKASLVASADADSPAFTPFLAAGSDAHGDFNYEATMDVVDFIGKPSRALNGYAEDNGWGQLFAVVHCPQGMGSRGENVLRALKQGAFVSSNGPLLIAGFDLNRNGDLDDNMDVISGGHLVTSILKSPPLFVDWESSNEFGQAKSLRLIWGTKSGELEPHDIVIPSTKGLASEGLFSVDLRKDLDRLAGKGPWFYLRLELRTATSAGTEYRCYTNPIWVKIEGQQ
jgi:hypothetical protein